MHPDLMRLTRALRDIPPDRPVTLIWPPDTGGPTLGTQTSPKALGDRIAYPTSAHALSVAWAILQGGFPRTYRTYRNIGVTPGPKARRPTPALERS